jgi:hypothetical protein
MRRVERWWHTVDADISPLSRRAGLSPALTAVLDVALAADKADRKLQSRIARKLAASTAVRSASNLLAR